MKVILLQKVPNLGEIDDIKEVSEGFARNFLFPRHLAVIASSEALLSVKASQQKKAKEEERDLKETQNLAAKLDGLEINIKEKAGTGGTLYSAVGAQKIAQALSKLGFEIGKKQIITKPIKEAGEYEVNIKLHHGLEAAVTVIVST